MAKKRIKLTSKHKSPSGGLNAAGRRAAKRQGSNLKPPVSAKQAKKKQEVSCKETFVLRQDERNETKVNLCKNSQRS